MWVHSAQHKHSNLMSSSCCTYGAFHSNQKVRTDTYLRLNPVWVFSLEMCVEIHNCQDSGVWWCHDIVVPREMFAAIYTFRNNKIQQWVKGQVLRHNKTCLANVDGKWSPVDNCASAEQILTHLVCCWQSNTWKANFYIAIEFPSLSAYLCDHGKINGMTKKYSRNIPPFKILTNEYNNM